MHIEIAKIRENTLFRPQAYGLGQRIVLILDTTFDLPESVSKILVENWLHLQVVRTNCIWQSERRELFARTIRANIRVRVNTQAKTTTRTFARIVCANSSRQCETALTVHCCQKWTAVSIRICNFTTVLVISMTKEYRTIHVITGLVRISL